MAALVLAGVLAAAGAAADEEYDRLVKEFETAQRQWIEALAAQRAQRSPSTKPSKGVLARLLSAFGIQVPASPATSAPADPAERFRPRFRAYAEKHLGKPEAIPALVWLISNGDVAGGMIGQPEEHSAWALEQLTTRYAEDPALARWLDRLRSAAWIVGRKPAINLFERIRKVHSDADARAVATFNLAYTLYTYAPFGRPSKKDRARAAGLFRQIIKDYADSSVADEAERFVFEIEHLQVGMKAPEIVGKDVEGKEIRLSQFRGQVVVLDFWGFW